MRACGVRALADTVSLPPLREENRANSYYMNAYCVVCLNSIHKHMYMRAYVLAGVLRLSSTQLHVMMVFVGRAPCSCATHASLCRLGGGAMRVKTFVVRAYYMYIIAYRKDCPEMHARLFMNMRKKTLCMHDVQYIH